MHVVGWIAKLRTAVLIAEEHDTGLLHNHKFFNKKNHGANSQTELHFFDCMYRRHNLPSSEAQTSPAEPRDRKDFPHSDDGGVGKLPFAKQRLRLYH